MKVSVVITAYNVEPYIEQSIKSVLDQTYTDLDVFVVEDCSTDNTLNIINHLVDSDPRVHLIQNEVNHGAGWSRRKGIQEAINNSDSEYILLLDGDDWLTDSFIKQLVERALETNADIVSGGITIKHDNGVTDTTSYGDCVTEDVDKVIKFWGERIVFMNNKLIRKTLHQQIPYSTRRYIEDTQVIIPQLYLANKVAYTDNCGYIYRMRDGSLTHQADGFKNALFRALCALDLIKFFKDKEEKYKKVINLEAAYINELKNLKRSNPTSEMVEKYKDEFIELSLNIISDLKI